MYHRHREGHHVSAWPGHHPYNSHTQAAPQVHRPSPPPPIHYPTHAQHSHQHQHHQRHHHQSTGMYHHQPFYRSNSRSPASYAPLAARSMHQNVLRGQSGSAPVLVSPLTHHQVNGHETISPVPATPASSMSPLEAVADTVRSGSEHAAPTQSIASTPTNAATAITPSPHSSATTVAAAANNAVTTKPPRPYTEYTMFYQLEREYILHRILTTEQEQALQTPGGDCAVNQPPALFRNDPLMPARYCSLPLRADWYISGKSKKPTKRKHRKSHGKIGFLELTRMIAARWAKVDNETRKYCKMMAAMELVKYKEDMESYNLHKERLSAIGEIPEDMKERMLKKQRVQEKRDARALGKRKRQQQEGSAAEVKLSAPPNIKADTVSSHGSAGKAKLEPIAHDSPHETSNYNDMEEFITSLVHDGPLMAPKPKAITTERSPKKRPYLRGRLTTTHMVAGATTALRSPAAVAAVDSFKVPPKQDDDEDFDGIKITFSGIDESEIAREFSRTVPTGTTKTEANMKMDPSFDYWDALVGNASA